MWYHDAHRRRPLPDRRHVVADRDRRHHDQPAARAPPRSSPGRPPSRCPASAPRWSTTRATRSSAAAATSRSPGRGRRCCAASTATPSATSETYWSPVRGPLLRRRRRQARRRRLPLAARPGRRRDERVRPPHLHHRGRVGARRPPRGGRGRRGRRQRRRHRPGDHRPTSSSAAATTRRPSWARRSASTWPRSSAPSPGPRRVIFTDELPKTRSGKIMRRLLRDVAEGRVARRHHHARRPRRRRGDQAPGQRVPTED